jgi:penicillin-binding protein 2A
MRSKAALFVFALLLAGILPVFSQSTHSIVLTWTASPTPGVNYNMYRATASAGPYTAIGGNITGLTYTDTSGVAGTTYFYYVTAVCNTTTTCPTGITGESAPTPPTPGVTFLGSPAPPPAAPKAVAN